VLLLWLAAPGWGVAADRLYYFVDERGVPHYSNVPADPRYQPLGQLGLEPGAARPLPSSPPAPAVAVPLVPVPVMPAGEPLPPEEGEDQDR
jgi:hypothetical protein